MALSLSSALFISCNQNNNAGKSSEQAENSTESGSAVVLVNNEINAAYADYSSLKNALVESDSEAVKKSASALSESLSKIEGCQTTADVAGRIASTTDIKEQRKEFTTVSSDLIALLKTAEVKEGTMFVQFCPMANAGEGAYWMASNSEIKNPYYGEEMLNCGEVTETINKK